MDGEGSPGPPEGVAGVSLHNLHKVLYKWSEEEILADIARMSCERFRIFAASLVIFGAFILLRIIL